MHGLSISCGPRGAELQTTGTVADRVVRSRAKSQHRIRRFAYVPSSAQPAEAATFTVRRQVECARCAASIAFSPPLAISGSKVSANRARFHLITAGWLANA